MYGPLLPCFTYPCFIFFGSAPLLFLALSLSPPLSLFHIFSVISHEPGIVGNSVLGDCLRRLFLAFFEDSDPGIIGNSVSDRNLPYSITLLALSLPRSGKGPCIMHTSKKMQWKVGSRYITPIQPYIFCRQLYPCYQIRLCSVIQFNCEDLLVVIWFPCLVHGLGY